VSISIHIRILNDIKAAFIEFANKVPFYGFVILCLDEEALQDIIPHINKKIITYGLTTQADIRAVDIAYNEFSSSYTLRYKGNEPGRINLRIPGIHNIKNSLVAVCIGFELGSGIQML
jgi:UDP-N-acetylmuramate--alanine ligase